MCTHPKLLACSLLSLTSVTLHIAHSTATKSFYSILFYFILFCTLFFLAIHTLMLHSQILYDNCVCTEVVLAFVHCLLNRFLDLKFAILSFIRLYFDILDFFKYFASIRCIQNHFIYCVEFIVKHWRYSSFTFGHSINWAISEINYQQYKYVSWHLSRHHWHQCNCFRSSGESNLNRSEWKWYGSFYQLEIQSSVWNM